MAGLLCGFGVNDSSGHGCKGIGTCAGICNGVRWGGCKDGS
ncbi:hypothetical protein [Erwinia sp. E602]|nr:hypothetical protein [Erwinia sp. E602]